MYTHLTEYIVLIYCTQSHLINKGKNLTAKPAMEHLNWFYFFRLFETGF